MKLAECSSQTPEMMSKNVSGNVVLSTNFKIIQSVGKRKL